MNNSGAVFPAPIYAARPPISDTDLRVISASLGLTKRELFAAMAMAGDWAAQNEGLGFFPADATEDCLRARSAVYVRAADSLIAELAKEPQA